MRRNEADIWGAHRGKGQLPRRHLASLADRRLRPVLQRRHAAENKKGRAPTHNLAEDLRVVNNVARENQRAERKKVKRLPRVLAPDNAS